MGPKRLPKRLLFGLLPADMGTPTAVGRRSGKWLSFDLVNDLEHAGVPLHFFLDAGGTKKFRLGLEKYSLLRGHVAFTGATWS